MTVAEFLKKERDDKKTKDVIPMLKIADLTSDALGDESLVKRALGLLSLWGECVYFDSPLNWPRS